jgi:hypothetical protein
LWKSSWASTPASGGVGRHTWPPSTQGSTAVTLLVLEQMQAWIRQAITAEKIQDLGDL